MFGNISGLLGGSSMSGMGGIISQLKQQAMDQAANLQQQQAQPVMGGGGMGSYLQNGAAPSLDKFKQMQANAQPAQLPKLGGGIGGGLFGGMMGGAMGGVKQAMPSSRMAGRPAPQGFGGFFGGSLGPLSGGFGGAMGMPNPFSRPQMPQYNPRAFNPVQMQRMQQQQFNPSQPRPPQMPQQMMGARNPFMRQQMPQQMRQQPSFNPYMMQRPMFNPYMMQRPQPFMGNIGMNYGMRM